MHGLQVYNTGSWLIQDQALHTDILTTHPYAFWCQHTKIDKYMALRTTMHPTAQTKLYAEIGGKPCMAEEIGSMGPSINCNENAGTFLRLNLYSLWANGSIGAMWWCNFDQDMLPYAPYVDNMGTETELGMMDKNYKPRPVLTEIKHFADFLSSLDFDLPPARTDAVCILSRDQDQWGVAYMTYILARQTGLNLRFAMADEPLPDAPLYILCAANNLLSYTYSAQKRVFEKAERGATVLVLHSAFSRLTHMRRMTGLEVDYCAQSRCRREFALAKYPERKMVCEDSWTSRLIAREAEVLARTEEGEPVFTRFRLGKGTVLVVNSPVDRAAVERNDTLTGSDIMPYYLFFREAMSIAGITGAVEKGDCPYVGITRHPCGDGRTIVVAVNFEPRSVTCPVSLRGRLGKVWRGNVLEKAVSLDANEAAVFEVIED
jgi:hypothetical protein